MQKIFKSEFPTFSAAEAELHSAAKAAGFNLLVMTKKPNATAPRRAVFRCCKGRKYASQSAEGVHVTKKRKTRTQMTECPFKIALKLVRGSSGGEVWVVDGVKGDNCSQHNHIFSPPEAFSRYRRETLMKLTDTIITRWNTGTRPMRILSELQSDPDPIVQATTRHDLRNLLNKHRAEQLAGRTPLQWLYNQLQSRDFFFEDLRDEKNHILCLFIAPKSGISLLRQHPDVLLCDSTYKTNRFQMPLFNLCGTTADKKTFQIATAFLNGEAEPQFAWAMSHFVGILKTAKIDLPRVIVTDRELALMNALANNPVLDSVPHILCRWHVNMNVLAKCKQHFPKATRQGNKTVRAAAFRVFLSDWKDLVNSDTKAVFEKRLADFQRPGKHPQKAVDYSMKTWITPWKEKLIRCYIDKYRHFGHCTTSIVESLHSTMKKFLWSSQGDLSTAFRALDLFWTSQKTTISTQQAISGHKQLTISLHILYANVRHLIAPQAITLMAQELATLDRKLETAPAGPCGTCYITAVFGLPCRHLLWRHQRDQEPLRPADVDRYWYWQRDAQSGDARTPLQLDDPYDPHFMQGKGRPKGALGLEKRAAVTTSRRDPILAERVEAWEKAEAAISRDLPIRESQYPDREDQPCAQPIKSIDPAPATDTTDAATAVEAAILRGASQPRSNPPPSTAPAAINTSKESTTSLGIKRLQAGDPYEPGTELHRLYMRAFQHLEDVSDDEAGDAASDGAGSAVGIATPREDTHLSEKNLAAAFSQFSLWSDTDASDESLHPGFEERMYRLAQELEAGGHDDVFDDDFSDFSDVTDDVEECPDSGPSIEVLGG